MEERLAKLEATLADVIAEKSLQNVAAVKDASLEQNEPNPFDNTTLIAFRIPKDCNDASITIMNTFTSEVISVIPISCNEDHVSVDAGVMVSGTYSYTLYMDGKIINTKQMVLIK